MSTYGLSTAPERGAAPLDPQVVEAARAARTRRLQHAARNVTSMLAVAFVAAAVVLAILLDAAQASPLVFLLFAAAYAIASRVDFEIGPGASVPTQLVFVPMLFVLPLGAVPLCVAVGLLAGNSMRSFREWLPLERLPLLLVSATHSLGPVLVFAVLGVHEVRWQLAPAYVAALAAQFTIDAAATWVAARSMHGGSLRSHLGVVRWVYLADAALSPIALALAFAAVQAPAAVLLALPLVALLSVFSRERGARIDHAVELSQAYRGTALLLGDVVEADDAYTGSHSRDVVELVLAVADELRLDPDMRREAEFTALLHDVGKIRMPAELIQKPGRLTPAERKVIETHTVEGQLLLEQVGGVLGRIGTIVRSCHEHYNGAGYPDRLAGEEIPLVARIVCCCDAYSAMTSDRPYRKALAPPVAIAELERCSGTQFDPAVVTALVSVLRRPLANAA